MKEIKEIRTIEEVVGYEAYDGTKFVDKTECEKYEKMTAEEAIENKFRNLTVAMFEEYDMTNNGCDEYVGSGVNEGFGIALVKIKDENDFNICKAFKNLHYPTAKNTFTEDMIGKEILVLVTSDYFGENKESGKWTYDNCWVFGTVEDQIKKYEEKLREAIKGGD